VPPRMILPAGMSPVRSLARAEGASPEDLGEATSNGMNALSRLVISINFILK